MNEKTYKINIAGRDELLPVLKLPSGESIAFFNLHGNVELTEFCAEKLAPFLKACDVLLTAESKGLQLTHCIAKKLGHKFYAVARKSKKLYMQDGISVEVKSITTSDLQHLYLSKHDSNLLKGKKVGIVDDVISTGGSLSGMEELVLAAGGIMQERAAVLKEGAAAERNDIKFLQYIPIFR